MQWSTGELQSHYEHLSDVLTVTTQVLIEQSASMLDEQRIALESVLANAHIGVQAISAEQNRRQNQTN